MNFVRLYEIIESVFSTSLNTYYQDVLRTMFPLKDYNSKYYFNFNGGSEAYCSQAGTRGYEVHIGKNFYLSIRDFHKHKEIPKHHVRRYVQDILKVTDGVFWHEMFHLLYTDMGFAHKFLSILKLHKQEAFKEYFFKLFNILEDQYIEAEGVYQFPYLNDGIRYLSYITSTRTKAPEVWDETNPHELLSYIYFKVRLPEIKVPNHTLYDDNKQFIDDSIALIMQTHIPTLRVERVAALMRELLKLFNFDYNSDMPQPDDSDELIYENVENPLSAEDYPISQDFNGPQNVDMPDINPINDPTMMTMRNMTDNSKTVRMGSEFVDHQQSTDEIKAKSPSSQAPDFFKNNIRPTSDTYINSLVNKIANDGDIKANSLSHQHDTTLKFRNITPQVNPLDIVKIHTEYSSLINYISQIFDDLKEMSRKKARVDLYTGDKLNTKSLYNPSMIGKYQSEISEVEVKDLAVHLMVDMSGSMVGEKSMYAMHTCYVLATALEYAEVPFQISYFSTDQVSYGAYIKRFDQPFTQQVKQNIALIDMLNYGIHLLHSASANIDESAILYAADNFNERPERNKLLIVLSDGATCGSRSALKEVVQSTLPEMNINTYGVGMYSTEVKEIYPDHTLIDNLGDLKSLPTNLSKYIMSVYASEV